MKRMENEKKVKRQFAQKCEIVRSSFLRFHLCNFSPRFYCYCFLSFTFYFCSKEWTKTHIRTHIVVGVGVECVRVVIYGPSVFVGICRTAGLPRQKYSRLMRAPSWCDIDDQNVCICVGPKDFLPSDLGKQQSRIVDVFDVGELRIKRNTHIHKWMPDPHIRLWVWMWTVEWKLTKEKSRIETLSMDKHTLTHIFIWLDY